MKKNMLYLFCIYFIVAVISCQKQGSKELSEEEILKILSNVVASEQSIEAAGLRYFAKLSAESNNIINAQTLQQRLSKGELFYILDIRREADYRSGHIESANNIWWFDIGTNIDLLPKNRVILVTCYSGQSAAQVVGVLNVMGYEALSLAGGMNGGWLAAGLPTVASN